MEERDSREGCWLAEWSLLHWRRSRAQTAHCTALFIFIKVEVLGFSPSWMEVGRYVVDGVGLDLSGCICVCLCGYTIYLSEGRETKWTMYGYENDELSSVTPHFLASTRFPIDTERQNSHLSFFPLFPFVRYKLWCHLSFETTRGPRRHSNVHFTLFGEQSGSISDLCQS